MILRLIKDYVQSPTTMSANTPSLMGMPLEIRQQIYQMLFEDNLIEFDLWTLEPYSWNVSREVFQLSKQINEEAKSVLDISLRLKDPHWRS